MRTGSILVLMLFLAPSAAEAGERRNLSYYDGRDRDDRKHRLDLYLPERASGPVPVLMFIHGGGWRIGDRWQYALIGRRMAERGIACAVISYRLSPRVKHPEHVRDCARAFAWLYRNVAKYGGDPERMFVSGHSAGGHLTALLALDPQWLAAEGVPAGAIRGAIPISGVLDIPPPGKGPKATRRMFREVFGCDADLRRSGNPLRHLEGSGVPLLVITETIDPGILRPMMTSFRREAERTNRREIEFVDVARGHISMVVLMMRKCDPVLDRVVRFIHGRAGTR